MKPIDQSIYNAETGDCMRAAWASILEFELEAVPHFILDVDWNETLTSFLKECGWEYVDESKGRPSKDETVNGYTVGAVQSYDFPGCLHAVVIDCEGVVVHDPGPFKNWQDRNVVEERMLVCYDRVRKYNE